MWSIRELLNGNRYSTYPQNTFFYKPFFKNLMYINNCIPWISPFWLVKPSLVSPFWLVDDSSIEVCPSTIRTLRFLADIGLFLVGLAWPSSSMSAALECDDTLDEDILDEEALEFIEFESECPFIWMRINSSSVASGSDPLTEICKNGYLLYYKKDM